MTGGGHDFTAMQPGAYGASKSALNMLTSSWAKELKDTRVKINAMTPGYTRPTSIGTRASVPPNRPPRSTCIGDAAGRRPLGRACGVT